MTAGPSPYKPRCSVALACVLAAGGAVLAAAPAKDPNADVDKVAKAQLKALGPGYRAQIDRHRHIIYLSALDDVHLRRTQELLTAFIDAQRRTLLTRPLPWNLTIVLPTVDDYKKLSAKLSVSAKTNGFYRPAARKLISIDRGRTLLHEFTHALHHADAAEARQVHPAWIREGLATLFEAGKITPSGLRPSADLRIIALKRAIRTKKVIPLERLFGMSQKRFMAEADVCYAEARYVMLYLHQRGRLRDWYKRYKRTYANDPTGRKALEGALGYRLFQIEPAWKKWVQSLQPPLGERRSGQGRLGVQVRDDPRGVKVTKLLDGSAARRAGKIRVGDVIERFNGRPVRNPGEFVGAVRASGAMQTVTIRLIRGGRRTTITQPLGAPGTR